MDPPDKLEKIQVKAIQVDNRLYERQLEKGGRPDRLFYANKSNWGKKRDFHYDPIDLDLV